MCKKANSNSLTSCISSVYEKVCNLVVLIIVGFRLFYNVEHIKAQEVIPDILVVSALSDDAKPTNERVISSEVLLDIFQEYGVTSYTQTMPFARTPLLHNVHSTDSIIALLSTQSFAAAKYQLAFEYFAKGELQLAQDELQAIDNNYELDALALIEHTQLEAYMAIMVQLAQSGNSIFQLNATQKAGLYNIYQNSTALAGAWATNILRTVDTLYYKENYLLPTIGNKIGIVRRKRPNNTTFETTKLKVYPNPANDYVIVEYQLADETDKAVVKIIDNNGFIRQTIAPENNHGFMVIDTRDLETGTYICHVAASGKLFGVAKFIIFK